MIDDQDILDELNRTVPRRDWSTLLWGIAFAGLVVLILWAIAQ